MDLARIDGIVPSTQLRKQLAGQTVLLAFSRGKDSIAAWLALRDADVNVVPYHLYLVPGLEFVDESLAYYASWFGTPILNLPHPSLYRWLANLMYQPPERCRVIEAARITVPSYAEVNTLIREHFHLPSHTWVCDGVRAADSPARRTAIAAHGPISERRRTQKVVWDWRKQHVMDTIRGAGLKLPPEYDWFGRSFDGVDKRFLGPILQHAPSDYSRILAWFPLADLELHRPAPARQRASRGGFRERAAQEAERFRLATDSEYWIALCFRHADGLATFTSALRLRPDGGYLAGPQLAEAVPAFGRRAAAPTAATAAVTRQGAPGIVPDPFSGMACTTDLAADAAAELAALLAAFTAPAGSSSVLDSPHYLAVYWPSRAAKDAWLASTGLDALGDKYLDGDAVAARLGLMPPRGHAPSTRRLARRLRLSREARPGPVLERTTHG